jgi:putative ABC transport system permease protein
VSSALLDRPARPRPAGGGVPARRAVARWAWRLFRREWRQQILVLALLTLAVAAAICTVSIAYNVAPLQEAEFGTANQLIKFVGSDPRELDRNVSAARDWFGTIDTIAHRHAPVPGSVETVDMRAQDPHGPYSAPMLRLREGRYPASAGEVALTDGVAATFQLGVGGRLTLDGRSRTVVGLVENPSDLGDEFALVSPAHADPAESVTILVRSSRDQVESFRDTIAGQVVRESRGRSEQVVVAVGMFGFVAVGLLLVSLVAAAGFAVVAQRRLRQLGMLAAIGATAKHLRLVMLVNGVVVGAIAAVLGTAAGLTCWIVVAPQLETAAEHRLDRLDLPWWVIGAGILLAVVTATAAAWWPARAVARVPVTLALSARPPRPKPAHHSAVLAAGLLATGFGCIVRANQSSLLLMFVGTVATGLGILFISPLAIRVLAAAGTRLPLAARLAVRDLARYQARAGAALAAISLALGIVVTIIVTATAAEYTADEGNLSARQLLVRIGAPNEPLIPDRTPAQLRSLQAQVDRLAVVLGNPTVIPLEVAVDAAAAPEPGVDESEGGRPADMLAERTGDNKYTGYLLYVATPQLLNYTGIDPGSIDPGTDVVTAQTGALLFLHGKGRDAPVRNVQHIDAPRYSSLPSSFITADSLRRQGWSAASAGWLIEARKPLTAAQLADAREVAADAGLSIEARLDQQSLLSLRWQATAAGMLLALGVLAMSVGLIRGEAAGDLRTLTAAGATSTVRRTLTATTASGLALLGAVVGTAGAYLGLIAGYIHDLDSLSRIPVGQLLVLLLGLPVAAAAAGWLLAGREPPALARRPLE